MTEDVGRMMDSVRALEDSNANNDNNSGTAFMSHLLDEGDEMESATPFKVGIY